MSLGLVLDVAPAFKMSNCVALPPTEVGFAASAALRWASGHVAAALLRWQLN